MTKRRKPTDYVNNKDFYDALVLYFQEVKEAEESGEEKPQIPDYIVECIMQIATRLSYKPNFIGYAFREDMVSDGIEDAIRRIHNFKPKYKNPFAYFTQIIFYAMVRRIQKEKKELYTKHKLIQVTSIMGTVAHNHDRTSGQADLNFLDPDNEYMSDFVVEYEKSIEKKKNLKKEKDSKDLS